MFADGLLLCDLVQRLECMRGPLRGVQLRPRVRAGALERGRDRLWRMSSVEPRTAFEQRPEGAGCAEAEAGAVGWEGWKP